MGHSQSSSKKEIQSNISLTQGTRKSLKQSKLTPEGTRNKVQSE